jgi:NADPH:quinone reductase-like Zn-dependent oxidoreductase
MNRPEPKSTAVNGTGPTGTTTATEVVLPGIVEPSGLQVRDRTLEPPAPGQVVLAMEAAGVSFAEQQMRRGKYYDQPPFPFVPGYDLVGTVTQVGAGVEGVRVGGRYAALTKTGAWASAVTVAADTLVPVPDGLDPAAAVTVVVNGITAWQLLHRHAEVAAGQTILVHGANGGVGSTLVQLARHAGVRVIGTCSPRHFTAVRALGAEPVDYASPDLGAAVRALAPAGVAAVFDHVGGPGIVDSWRLVAPGGTLVSSGSAATKDAGGSARVPILALFGRLLWWNLLPNRRRAVFFNIWSGLRRRDEFYARLRADLGRVFDLLAAGALTAQVAARLPLTEAAAALELAESRTVVGKVVLVPTRS